MYIHPMEPLQVHQYYSHIISRLCTQVEELQGLVLHFEDENRLLRDLLDRTQSN